MKTLYQCTGLPASGKSTWAKDKVLKAPNGSIKLVGKDNLRAMLDVGRWSKTNEVFVLQTRDSIIRNALALGCHVISDDTNLAPKHQKTLRGIAEQAGAKFELVDFTHVSVEECIRRDQKRPNYVGEKVIRDMYNQYLAPPPTPPLVQDPSLPHCVIVDIDGTVALMNGRGPYETDKYLTDLPNAPIVSLVRELMAGDTYVIFVSGRDERGRADTEAWLTAHVTGPIFKKFPNTLFMRPAGDTRADYIIKTEIFEREFRNKYFVRFTLDDREQVVTKCWRALGLTCLAVAEGNF